MIVTNQPCIKKKNQIVEKIAKLIRLKAESSVGGQPADYQRLPQESIVQSKLGQSQGSSSENDCLKMIYHFMRKTALVHWPQNKPRF